MSFLKVLAASGIMGFIGWALLHGELWEKSGNFAGKALYFSGTFVLCIAVYIAASYLLKNEELNYVIDILKVKFKRRGVVIDEN